MDEEGEEEIEGIEDLLGISAIDRAEMAKEDGENMIKFTNYHKSYMFDFVLYCDFEASLERNEETGRGEHKASGFSCVRIASHDALNNDNVFSYNGANAMDRFFECLEEQRTYINEVMSRDAVPMIPLNEEERDRVKNCTNCFCCDEKFVDNKVTHHNHISGKFVGAACQRCNLMLKPQIFRRHGKSEGLQYTIPVIFHNGKAYDNNFILKALRKEHIQREIFVIANSSERFISFNVDNFKFIDSAQYLPASLDSLVNNLREGGESNFVHTKRFFSDPEQFKLLQSKLPFCYDYITLLAWTN